MKNVVKENKNILTMVSKNIIMYSKTRMEKGGNRMSKEERKELRGFK